MPTIYLSLSVRETSDDGANPLLELGRDDFFAERIEMQPEALLELGARETAPAQCQMVVDVPLLFVGNLAVEVLEEQTQNLLAIHRCAFCHDVR
jgi:hypothetical protein